MLVAINNHNGVGDTYWATPPFTRILEISRRGTVIRPTPSALKSTPPIPYLILSQKFWGNWGILQFLSIPHKIFHIGSPQSHTHIRYVGSKPYCHVLH